MDLDKFSFFFFQSAEVVSHRIHWRTSQLYEGWGKGLCRILYIPCNTLPQNKTLAASKLKLFADSKSNIKLVFHRIENIARKGENVFKRLFTIDFQKMSLYGKGLTM